MVVPVTQGVALGWFVPAPSGRESRKNSFTDNHLRLNLVPLVPVSVGTFTIYSLHSIRVLQFPPAADVLLFSPIPNSSRA
jgi:hypothetical protein